MRKKYLCYSDTHFNFTFPWTQYDFVSRILEENPAGLFLPGDISCGITIGNILKFLAKKLENIPIYFVIGNHDYYSTSFEQTHNTLFRLQEKYKNLHWLTSKDEIKLNEETALIGEDGWYDVRLGNPVYLNYNLDWIMISDFRKCSNFDEKVALSRKLADQSTANLKQKLEKALITYKTVYVITHVPPWEETARGRGMRFGEFWLPYNVNYEMGQMIEDVMRKYPDKNVITIGGHVHNPAIVHIAHNVECFIQEGKYIGYPREHNIYYI